MSDDLFLIEHDGDGVWVNGVLRTIHEVHACGYCTEQRPGTYRDGMQWWQCDACGCVFEVGVTW